MTVFIIELGFLDGDEYPQYQVEALSATQIGADKFVKEYIAAHPNDGWLECRRPEHDWNHTWEEQGEVRFENDRGRAWIRIRKKELLP